jgi:hypothetical protein
MAADHEYLGRALECERLALQISDHHMRQQLLDASRSWRLLAATNRLVNGAAKRGPRR